MALKDEVIRQEITGLGNGILLTSFLEAAALCNGVSHTWSLAFTVAPGRQKNHIF